MTDRPPTPQKPKDFALPPKIIPWPLARVVLLVPLQFAGPDAGIADIAYSELQAQIAARKLTAVSSQRHAHAGPDCPRPSRRAHSR